MCGIVLENEWMSGCFWTGLESELRRTSAVIRTGFSPESSNKDPSPPRLKITVILFSEVFFVQWQRLLNLLKSCSAPCQPIYYLSYSYMMLRWLYVSVCAVMIWHGCHLFFDFSASQTPKGPAAGVVACGAGDSRAVVQERGGRQEGRPPVKTPPMQHWFIFNTDIEGKDKKTWSPQDGDSFPTMLFSLRRCHVVLEIQAGIFS